MCARSGLIWFKSGKFGLNNTPESLGNATTAIWNSLLTENPAQTQEELAEQLGVTQQTLLRTATNVG